MRADAGLKKLFGRLTKPIAELDIEDLRELCAEHAECVAMSEVEARQAVDLVGEITAIRIVPRDGSPTLEATITDGTGSVVAVWTGRRKIGGITPGRRLVITGRGAPIGPGNRLLFYNPRYELLA